MKKTFDLLAKANKPKGFSSSKNLVPCSSDYTHHLRPIETALNTVIYPTRKVFDDAYVRHKYEVERLNLSEIARELFTSRHTIRTHLERIGVPIRSQIDQGKMQKSKKYGFHQRKGETAKKHTEARVIDAIFKMKDEGMSLRAISSTLDTMKIPTKKKGKKWQYEMVRQILIKNNHSAYA